MGGVSKLGMSYDKEIFQINKSLFTILDILETATRDILKLSMKVDELRFDFDRHKRLTSGSNLPEDALDE